MLVRWLVGNLIREAARGTINDVVTEFARDQVGRADAPDNSTDPAADSGPPACDVAVLFAMGVESGGLRELIEGSSWGRFPSRNRCQLGRLAGRGVAIMDSGVGGESAARATSELIACLEPAWVISAGFAGGLTDETRRGHVLMADQVVHPDGRSLELGLRMRPADLQATKGLHVGRLVTVENPIRSAQEKRDLGQQHDALACDMETWSVAEVCRRLHTRLISVRVVSDAVDDQLPPEIERLVTQKSTAGQWGAVAGALLNRPSSAKDLWQLKQQAFQASDRLARFLTGVIGQLEAKETKTAEKKQ